MSVELTEHEKKKRNKCLQKAFNNQNNWDNLSKAMSGQIRDGMRSGTFYEKVKDRLFNEAGRSLGNAGAVKDDGR